MHLTFAFILTLLSTSAVLAQTPLHPYAGYMVRAPPGRSFTFAHATFTVPFIRWECDHARGGQAFIGVRIGYPMMCGNRGIEAGVSMICAQAGISYQAYWKLFPQNIRSVRIGPIRSGHEIQVVISSSAGGTITVYMINLTTLNLSPDDLIVGNANDIRGCRRTVAWGLRVNLIRRDTELIPPPSFQGIAFRGVGAVDSSGRRYGLADVREGGRLVLSDSWNNIWAYPERDEVPVGETPRTFKIWS